MENILFICQVNYYPALSLLENMHRANIKTQLQSHTVKYYTGKLKQKWIVAN